MDLFIEISSKELEIQMKAIDAQNEGGIIFLFLLVYSNFS